MAPFSSDPATWGAYPVAASHRGLLTVIRRQPRAGVGKRLAHVLRRLFIWTHRDPVDAEIDGFRMRVSLRGNVSERRYFFTPHWVDPVERGFIEARMPAGGRFVDVGANAGIYSLWAARAGGPGARVLAIEANPAMADRLAFNLTASGLADRVTIARKAVGEETGTATLTLDARNLGGSSLRAATVSATGETVTVPMQPLAEIVRDAGLATIDILKIDIEGWEPQALLPFFATADQALWPRHLIVEHSPQLWDQDLGATLVDLGYAQVARGRGNVILSLEPDSLEPDTGQAQPG